MIVIVLKMKKKATKNLPEFKIPSDKKIQQNMNRWDNFQM